MELTGDRVLPHGVTGESELLLQGIRPSVNWPPTRALLPEAARPLFAT